MAEGDGKEASEHNKRRNRAARDGDEADANDDGGAESSMPQAHAPTSTTANSERVSELFTGTQDDGTGKFIIRELILREDNPETWKCAEQLTGFKCIPFRDHHHAGDDTTGEISWEPRFLMDMLTTNWGDPVKGDYALHLGMERDVLEMTEERFAAHPEHILGQIDRFKVRFDTRGGFDELEKMLKTVTDTTLALEVGDRFAGLTTVMWWRYLAGRVI
jgi:hypothetical protein